MNESEARALFVSTARKYIGCRESDGSHRQIINIYNTIRPLPRNWKMPYSGQNSAWCATFVSAMAKVAGMLDIIPAECSCWHQVQGFQKLGRWMERDDYKPKPGDVIYYDWSDSGAGDCTGRMEGSLMDEPIYMEDEKEHSGLLEEEPYGALPNK